jgi:AbrB family looped-hinge helix DNA binding protein
MVAADVEAEATVTAKGQITIPSAVRAALGVSPGDKIRFEKTRSGEYRIKARRRRSILDIAHENPLPKMSRPIEDSDIDEAVAEAMEHRMRRAGIRRPK